MSRRDTWTLTHLHGEGFKFDPTRIYEHPGYHQTVYKPHGLWLSDERNGGDDGWLAWCDEVESRRERSYATDFAVDVSNVLVLRTDDPFVYAKIEALPRMQCEKYRDEWHTHWTEIAKRYAGVYLDGNIWDKEDTGTEEPWRLCWDCAAACVWDLNCVKLIGRRESHARRPEFDHIAAGGV